MDRSLRLLVVLGLVACDSQPGDDETTTTSTTSSTSEAEASSDTGDAETTSCGVVMTNGTDGTSTGEGASSGADSTSTGEGEASTGTTGGDGSSAKFDEVLDVPIPNAWFPVTANLDGDAADDLVIASSNAPSMSAILGADPTDPFFAAAQPSQAIAPLDFDGDGDDDIAAVQFDGLTDRFASYRTGGTKLPEVGVVPVPDCSYHLELVTADLNADEHDDVVMSCSNLSAVIVLPGQGNGSFGAPVKLEFDAVIVGIAVLDVIGSEWPDLIAYDQNNPRLLVYPGTGDLSFDTVGMQSFPTAAVGYGRMGVGDLDGDDRQDIVVNHTIDGFCAPFFGTDDGLTPGPTFPCGPYAADIQIGDMNGDSLGDIVLVHFFNSLPGELHVLINQGDDTFAAPDVYETGFNTVKLALGDYNGDALPDAAVVSEDLVTFFYQAQ